MCPMAGIMYSTVESNVDESFLVQRQTYIFELLGCLPNRFGVRIHAYVLMGGYRSGSNLNLQRFAYT